MVGEIDHRLWIKKNLHILCDIHCVLLKNLMTPAAMHFVIIFCVAYCNEILSQHLFISHNIE